MMVAIGVFLADLLIKGHVERMEFPEKREKRFAGGAIILRRHHNHGAMLGLGHKKPGVMTVLSVLATLFALVLLVLSASVLGNRMMRTGLSLLLGGAFSNTYDRLKRKYVVDYLSFGVPWEPLRRLVFNISDFCIMIGALLTVLGACR